MAAAAAAVAADDTTTIITGNILAHEYTMYNIAGGESLTQRNDRWTKLVNNLLKPDEDGDLVDIAALQEATVGFIAYAFDGVMPEGGDEAKVVYPGLRPKPSEFQLACGKLGKVFYCVFCKRNYHPGTKPKPGKVLYPKNDGSAVIFRRDKYAPNLAHGPTSVVLSSSLIGQFSLKSLKSEHDPRCFAAVDVVTLTGQPVATVISVHLEGDPESDVRPKQIAEAVAAAKLLASKSPIMILAGDFNERPTTSILKALADNGLTRLPIYVDPKSNEPSDSCTWGMEAIDHIAVSDPTMVLGGVMHVLPRPASRVKAADAVDVKGRTAKGSAYATPPYAEGGKWPSDHCFGKIKLMHKAKPVVSVTTHGASVVKIDSSSGGVTTSVATSNSPGVTVVAAGHGSFLAL